MKMALNAELPISIEHKIHRVHYQQQHHHYHVHQLINNQHNHLYHHNQHLQYKNTNHSQTLLAPGTNHALSRIISNNHHEHHHHNHEQHLQHHHHNLNQRNHHDHRNHEQLETHQSTGKKLPIVVSPVKRDNQQTIAARNRQQQAAKTAQKSQIQFFLIAALTYILSPIDMVPEVIFGVFGLLDDILFLFLCMFCIAIVLLYPIFREMQRTIFNKLGLKQPSYVNKSF